MADVSLEQQIERLQQGLREIGRMCLELGGDGQVVGRAADTKAVDTAVGNRRLVYVHGICDHKDGFSNPWWEALRPYVGGIFGDGRLGETRLEVVWSDIVNKLRVAIPATVGAADNRAALASQWKQLQFAEEIAEGVQQRYEQHASSSDPPSDKSTEPACHTERVITPATNCIDDFAIYMVNGPIRQQILNRFINKVRPELSVSRELDIISHSWGTVVAYEGLRQLEDEGVSVNNVRNFFTVGSPLWLFPVRWSLRPRNQNGRKPANVRRWVNVSAVGDVFGGRLDGPYQVDHDFHCVAARGCGRIDPECAHRSYFHRDNEYVNKIFGGFIGQP